MMAIRSPIVWLLYGAGLLAVAGLVHIATLLALPSRLEHGAFVRIAEVTAVNEITPMKPAVSDLAIPFRDNAMRAVLCRYDLRPGPLRLTVDPFDTGFLSLGMHSRASAFYGLNLRASDTASMSIVLMTAQQKSQAESNANDDGPSQELRITAPEADGFVVIETPDDDPALAEAALSHVHCGSDIPPNGDTAPDR